MNRILLIEDDSSAQLLYGNRLTDLGYQVVIAATGARGLMEARAAPFDLFLVDIDLGKGIDGYEVCQRLKTIPEIHGVPVVLISGHVKTQEDLHRGYEAGCQSFLVKGDLMLLEDVVRAMLRIKSLQDELAVQNRLLGRVEAEKARGPEEPGPPTGASPRPTVRPDGLLLVDGEGVVVTSDRGAREIFGQAIEGKHLAVLAPDSRLEAVVRNARFEPQDGVRFEVPERAGRAARPMFASVHPFVPRPDPVQPSLRLVQLHSAVRQRPWSEGARIEDGSLPRDWQPLLETARDVYRHTALLGSSQATRALRARLTQLAQSETPVLLRGPRGSGKSFAARVLHFSGVRSGPFVTYTCGVSPSTEQELFGIAKGATPGAEAEPGAVHAANTGTLFLQDVERLSPDLQLRLVDLLANGRVLRKGASTPERVDVRLVASSRTDASRPGSLVPELESRFAGATLVLAALRERTEDITPLAQFFLQRHARHEDAQLAPEILSAFARYDWPGNVRELEQVVQRAAACAAEGFIPLSDLPLPFPELYRAKPDVAGRAEAGLANLERELTALHASIDSTVSLLDAYEKGALLHALQLAKGDKLYAAKLLKIGKSTFYRKLKQHGIS